MTDALYTHLTVKEDGGHRVSFSGLTTHELHTLTFEWVAGVPGGTLRLSVDGDAGENSMVQLSSERVRNFVGKPVFIDMAFAGLPANCELKVHFR